MNAGERGEIVALRRRLALGHGEEFAVSATVLMDSLVAGIAHLKRTDQPLVIHITGGALLPRRLVLRRNDPLLPLWRRFAWALSKTRTLHRIDLHVTHASLTDEILEVLEPALSAAPLDYLMLSHCRLGPGGVRCAARVLRANPRVRYLVLSKNEIQETSDLLLLVEAAREHPSLEYFNLEGCGIGRKLAAVPSVVPDVLSLHTVNLTSNDIGSAGAAAISACLTTNSAITILVLDDNQLNDDDALLLAASLKNNTRLLQLDLCSNNFTHSGIRTLIGSTFDDRSFNAIRESNHTCQLKLSTGGSPLLSVVDDEVLTMNGNTFGVHLFPEEIRNRCVKAARGDRNKLAQMMLVQGRTRAKMILAFWYANNSTNYRMKYLKDTPLELLPLALAFLQDCGKYAGTQDKNLDAVLEVVRSSPGIMSFLGAVSNDTSVRKEQKIALPSRLRKYASLPKTCSWKQFGIARGRIARNKKMGLYRAR